MGFPIPPVEDEIALIRSYGARTLGLALNTHGLEKTRRREVRDALAARLGVPVVCPLEDGVEPLVAAVRRFAAEETA